MSGHKDVVTASRADEQGRNGWSRDKQGHNKWSRASEEAARVPLNCNSGTSIAFMSVTVQQRKLRVA